MDFCGKVAIVTGATSGIGEETARQLMAKGAQVLAVGRSVEKGAELEKQGAKFYACDLSDPAQIEDLCAQVAGDYPKVDILINNAGMQVRGRAEEIALGDWDRLMELNVTALFEMSRLAARESISCR